MSAVIGCTDGQCKNISWIFTELNSRLWDTAKELQIFNIVVRLYNYSPTLKLYKLYFCTSVSLIISIMQIQKHQFISFYNSL